MKKNTASQSIGAQMVSATDGTAFTGTVTVYITGDAGTQALGSVGSGVCTHEGNGYHTYAPAQAETNYNQIAFTFIGTGAIPQTVQLFTSFPQTVDLSTGITAGTITTVTNVTTVNGLAANTITASALATDAVTEIQAGLSTLSAANVADAVWNAATATYGSAGSYGLLIETNIDGAITTRASQSTLDALDDYVDTEVAAIKAKTDSLTFTVAGQVDANIQYVNDIAVGGVGTEANPWSPA